MPDFEYRGPSPGMFPMLRDSYGIPAGTVKPGDIMRLDECPDPSWVLLDPGEAERAETERRALADATAELISTAGPGGGQGVQDDTEAGQPGSEED